MEREIALCFLKRAHDLFAIPPRTLADQARAIACNQLLP
jgi:hypothetical protein